MILTQHADGQKTFPFQFLTCTAPGQRWIITTQLETQEEHWLRDLPEAKIHSQQIPSYFKQSHSLGSALICRSQRKGRHTRFWFGDVIQDIYPLRSSEGQQMAARLNSLFLMAFSHTLGTTAAVALCLFIEELCYLWMPFYRCYRDFCLSWVWIYLKCVILHVLGGSAYQIPLKYL